MLDNNTIVAEWYDIYGIHTLPFWQQTHFIWGVSIVIMVLFCIAGVIVLYRYKKRTKYVSPHTKALIGLQKIRSHYLHEQHARDFYVQLTSIAKQYISEVFHLDVCAKTDTEMLAMIQSEDRVKGMSSLSPIFVCVERVKFAVDTVDCYKMKHDSELLEGFIRLHSAQGNDTASV